MAGYTPFLHDDCVALTPLDESCIPRMVGWVNDVALMRFVGMPGNFSTEQEREWLVRMRNSVSDMVLGIIRCDTGEHIGNVGLHGISAVHHHAEYGICLGEKSSWGQGFGTSAGRLILDYGFNQRNLARIFLRVLGFNERGIRSYDKLGFALEGRQRRHVWVDGAYHDMVLMGLLRDEFNERHASWREHQRQRYGLDN
jgi:RimJ/RimL family protein N-acetyltransferase